MKLLIRDLQRDEGKFLPYDGTIVLDADGAQTRPCLTISLQAAYIPPRVLVRGEWRADLQGECSRCLEKFSYRLEDNFYEEFTQLPGPSPEPKEADGGLELEKGERYVFRGEILDLTEYFRQLFLMSQPLKILCREDCRGLCPLCGANQNKERCTCQQEEVDPRWSALGKIKRQMDST